MNLFLKFPDNFNISTWNNWRDLKYCNLTQVFSLAQWYMYLIRARELILKKEYIFISKIDANTI